MCTVRAATRRAGQHFERGGCISTTTSRTAVHSGGWLCKTEIVSVIDKPLTHPSWIAQENTAFSHHGDRLAHAPTMSGRPSRVTRSRSDLVHSGCALSRASLLPHCALCAAARAGSAAALAHSNACAAVCRASARSHDQEPEEEARHVSKTRSVERGWHSGSAAEGANGLTQTRHARRAEACSH